MPSPFEITPKSPDQRNRKPRYTLERPLSSTHASQEKIESLEAQNNRIRKQLDQYEHETQTEMHNELQQHKQRTRDLMEKMLTPEPGDEDEAAPDYFRQPAGAFSGDTHQYHGIHGDERSPWAIANAQEHTFTGHGGKKIDRNPFAPVHHDAFRTPTQPIPLQEHETFIKDTENVFGEPTDVDAISDSFSGRDGDTLVGRNPFAEQPSERPNPLRGPTEPWKKPAPQSPSLQERMAAVRRDTEPNPFDSSTHFDRSSLNEPFTGREAIVPPAPNPELIRKSEELRQLEIQAKKIETLVEAKTKGFEEMFDADPARAVANSLSFGERLMLGLNRGVFGMRGNILPYEASASDLLSTDFLSQKRAYSKLGPKQALEDWKKYNDESMALFGQISDLKKEIAQLQKAPSAPKNPHLGHQLRQRFAQRDHIPSPRRDQRIFSGQELPPLPNEAEQLNQRFDRAFADRGISIDKKNHPDDESLRERLWFMNHRNDLGDENVDADEIAEAYLQEEKDQASRNTLSIEPMTDQDPSENTIPDFAFQPTERQSSPFRQKTIDSGPPKGKIFFQERGLFTPSDEEKAKASEREKNRLQSLPKLGPETLAYARKKNLERLYTSEKNVIRRDRENSLNKFHRAVDSFIEMSSLSKEDEAILRASFVRYYDQREREAFRKDIDQDVSAETFSNIARLQMEHEDMLAQALTFASGRIDNFQEQIANKRDARAFTKIETLKHYTTRALQQFLNLLTNDPEISFQELEKRYSLFTKRLNEKESELLSSTQLRSEQSA